MQDERPISFVYEFSESKVALTPPPLLEGGEGGRGRDGTLGNSRKGVKGKVCVAADPTKK